MKSKSNDQSSLPGAGRKLSVADPPSCSRMYGVGSQDAADKQQTNSFDRTDHPRSKLSMGGMACGTPEAGVETVKSTTMMGVVVVVVVGPGIEVGIEVGRVAGAIGVERTFLGGGDENESWDCICGTCVFPSLAAALHLCCKLFHTTQVLTCSLIGCPLLQFQKRILSHGQRSGSSARYGYFARSASEKVRRSYWYS